MSIAYERLVAERKKWRTELPPGFYARPQTRDDDSQNLFIWDCKIPGSKGTIWEGSIYPLTVTFSQDYPQKPPKCAFPKDFYHPNIYPSGTVCLSILNEEKDWRPGINIKEILLGIRDLLAVPNPDDPAQSVALKAFNNDKDEYEAKVKEQAAKYKDKI